MSGAWAQMANTKLIQTIFGQNFIFNQAKKLQLKVNTSAKKIKKNWETISKNVQPIV